MDLFGETPFVICSQDGMLFTAFSTQGISEAEELDFISENKLRQELPLTEEEKTKNRPQVMSEEEREHI